MTEKSHQSEFNAPDAWPENPSFEQAMALTQELLEQVAAGAVDEMAFQGAIATLVRTTNGARGFFVVLLSDDRPLIDALLPSVPAALAASPDTVSPLLVKNLAMSTAMAITHRRNQDEDLAAGSDRVRGRAHALIAALPLPQLQDQAQQLLTSLATGAGEYQTFLNRWGYDAEQKQAMAAAIAAVIST